MKFLLTLCVLLVIIIPAVLGHFRYSQNKLSVTPYPFYFEETGYQKLATEAPILIIGDRMGNRLATFKDLLAEKLSVNLSEPIKISTMAHEGDSIHRTLEKLRSLPRIPLIIIYLGNTDQAYEKLFHTASIPKIQANFKLFQHDLVRTILMIYPELSRLVYNPVKYIKLGKLIHKDEKKYTDLVYQHRMKIHYLLYEAAVDEFFNFIKKRNSLLIPITTPINLDMAPYKSCYGSLTADADKQTDLVKKYVQGKNYKDAYNLSKDLVLTNSTNAELLYIHGQILKKLNQFQEAQRYNEMAVAFDCGNPRGSPVFNVILKRAANKYKYSYFDFHQLLVDNSKDSAGFIDEIYPQDVFLEKLVTGLANKIKKRLKL